VYSPSVKYIEFPPTGYNIEDYSLDMTTPVNMPDFVNRQWSLTGTINDASSTNRTKTITFYWLSDDDDDYDWSLIPPAVFLGSNKLSTISYTIGNPRSITVAYALDPSKAVFKIGMDDITLPVQLSSFNATINAYNYVQLRWVTQTESNLGGYRIYRSDADDLQYATVISELISATNSSQAQTYVYTDPSQLETGIYYYWLESQELSGSNGYHGPVMVNYSQPGTSSPSIPVVQGINSVYPNPFNPSTTIGFGIEKDSKVRIVIYNSRGQLVRELVNGSYAKGNYTLAWNAKDNNGRSVSSGIYTIRMTGGNQDYVRKIMLMK